MEKEITTIRASCALRATLLLWLALGVVASAAESSRAPSTDPHAGALTESAHGAYSESYNSDWGALEDGRADSRCPSSHAWKAPTTIAQAAAFVDGALKDETVLSGLLDPYVTITGDELRLIVPEDAGEAWALNWNRAPGDDPSRTLYIRNMRYVEIDGLAIRQLGHMSPTTRDDESLGYHGTRTAKSTIQIEGCEKAVLRNLCLEGPVDHSHIRISGCREVYIENVDIGGVSMADLFWDDDGSSRADADELVLGGGITIHNGTHDSPGERRCQNGTPLAYCPRVYSCDDQDAEDFVQHLGSRNVRSCSNQPWSAADPYCELEWLVIENSHFHDYTFAPDSSSRNHDAVALTSPACGVMFNNVVENWPAERTAPTATASGADAMLDIGHRRPCDLGDYSDHVFRVERNVFLAGEHGSLVKTTGVNGDEVSAGQSAIVFANNLFRNVNIVDYHARYPIYFYHGSAAFTSPTGSDPALGREQSKRRHFHKQIGDCLPAGGNRFRNNMVRALTPWNHACSWHTFPEDEDEPDTRIESRLMTYHTDGWFPSDYLNVKLDTDFNEYMTYLDAESTVWLRNFNDVTCDLTEYVTDAFAFPPLSEWQALGHDAWSEAWYDCDHLYRDGTICHGAGLAEPIDSFGAAYDVPRDFFGLLRGSTPDIGALESFTLGRIAGMSPVPLTTQIAKDIRCGLILGNVAGSFPDCPDDPSSVDANLNGIADCAECDSVCDIASGKSYVMVPTPNYREDIAVGDGTDLTDDLYDRALPGRETSVAWRLWPRVRIDIDLERATCASNPGDCRPISEIRFHVKDTDGDGGGTPCPERAWFYVGDDAQSYRLVATWERGADCASSGHVTPGPGHTDDVPNYFVSSGPLETRGAFVRVEIDVDDRFLSIDEIDVFAGVDPHLTNYIDTPPELGSSWRVVTGPAWDELRADSFSTSSLDATSVALDTILGEPETFALAISNPDVYSPLEFDVTVDDWVAADGSRILSDTIDVRFAALAPTLALEERADALFPLREGVTASIPPRSVGHLLVTVRTPRFARPGSYASTLEVRCDDCSPAVWSVDLGLEITAVTLPKSEVDYFDWSYSIPESDPWITGTFADDRLAIRQRFGATSHVSYFVPLPEWVDGSIELDFASHFDPNLDRYAGWEHVIYLAGSSPRHRNVGGVCYSDVDCEDEDSECWGNRFEEWIRAIRDHMAERGNTTESYVLHPVDEPGDRPPRFEEGGSCPRGFTRMELFKEMAARIKEVDPSLRVLVNLDRNHTVSEATALYTEGLVDVWVPHLSSLQSADLRDFYTARRTIDGQRVWAYNDSLDTRISGSHVHPFLGGRLLPWRLRYLGLQGYGYWALYDPGKDGAEPRSLWSPLNDDRPPWSTVYLKPEAGSGYEDSVPALGPEDEQILPSRRLAALHQGIVDIRKLELLASRSSSSRGSVECATAWDEAWMVVNSAPASIVESADDVENFASWLDRLDDSIELLVPRTVLDLEIAAEGSTTVLSWADSGLDVLYDIAGGTLAELRQSEGGVESTCLHSGLEGTTWTDGSAAPAPGQGNYYIVRASIECATGDFGMSVVPRLTECP